MKRRLFYARRACTFNGQPFRKGDWVGPDEPQPDLDGGDFWFVDREEPDPPVTGPQLGRVSPAYAEAFGLGVPVVQKPALAPPAPPAALGDHEHPWPAAPLDDSDAAYQDWQGRLRAARAAVDAENERRETKKT